MFSGENPSMDLTDKSVETRGVNLGNIYGTCVGLAESIDSNLKIYKVKPLILGKYGSPVRVMTAMNLRKGNIYSIKGHIETINVKYNMMANYQESITVPVLVTTKVTLIEDKATLFTNKSDDLSRIGFASFIYIDELTVTSISKQQKETIVILRKEHTDNKYLNILDIISITTTYSRHQIDSLTVGQKVSIYGTLHRDQKYDYETHTNEIGIKIMKFNPPPSFVDKLKSNIDLLHTQQTEPTAFENLMSIEKASRRKVNHLSRLT